LLSDDVRIVVTAFPFSCGFNTYPPPDPSRHAQIPRDFSVVEGRCQVDGCEEGLQPEDERLDFVAREQELVCLRTNTDNKALPIN
jgi:hypothetical protein